MALGEFITRRKVITAAGSTVALGLLGYTSGANQSMGTNPETVSTFGKPVAVPNECVAPVPMVEAKPSVGARSIDTNVLNSNGQNPTAVTEFIDPDILPNELGYLEKYEFDNAFNTSQKNKIFIQRLHRNSGRKEITGLFPDAIFKFSDAIKNSGLTPEVLSPKADIDNIFTVGRVFIDRVMLLLEQNPNLRGPKLNEIGINGFDNLAIEIPQDADLFDLLKQFRKDYQRNVIFEKFPLIGTNFLMAVSNYPSVTREGVVTAEARVDSNIEAILKDREHFEEFDTVYYQYTNAQIAAKMLHEYMHPLQFRGAFAILKTDISKYEQMKGNPAEVAAWIRREERKEKTRLENMLYEKNNIPLHILETISTNEAQANLASQLMISILNRANGKRYPGFSDDNGFPLDNDSLYQVFEQNVLPNAGKPIQPYNQKWLMKHAAWGM